MSVGKEESDVFYSGVLLYKPRALKSCQKCRAELKFESRNGLKRLELYPFNGNRRMPRSPTTVIHLTNALGVVNAKQHTITRAKHIFQIITQRERYQLSALTEEDKAAWLVYLDRILNHIPVDNRTYEFHVSVSPTTHSDSLKLNGQYLLKISETELHLYSAAGTIQSKFWSPLTSIRDAQHYLVPTSSSSPLSGWSGGILGAARNPGTQYLLVITTEGSCPNIGRGLFAFFTDSAKDIATTIIQRKEARIVARSIETQNPSQIDSLDQDVKSFFKPKPQSMKTANNKIVHENPRTLSEGEGLRKERKQEKDREEMKNGRLRERGDQSSVRMCQRGTRKIPVSHQREKAQFTLPLHEVEQQILSPEEPTHIPLNELTKYQMEYKRLKREEAVRKTKTSPAGILSPGSTNLKHLSRTLTISTSTPELEQSQISNVSSLDCTYVSIHRDSTGWEMEFSGEEKTENENEEEKKGEERVVEEKKDEEVKIEKEMSIGKMKGLERQKPIDIVSPSDDEESDYIMMRPRTNAFFFFDHSPPRASPPRTTPTHLRHQQATYGKTQPANESQIWCCDEESCQLRPHPPASGATKQRKSDSDPQLRINSCCSDVEYLKIIPYTGKSPKKPKPTPRSRKPPSNLYCRNSPFMKTTPPTPTLGLTAIPSPHRTLPRGVDVGKILTNQRSLSESNLFLGTSSPCGDPEPEDDDYVDMTQYNPLWDHQKHYVACNQFLDPHVTRRGGDVERRRMRRQISNSCGDIPAIMDAPQPLYENTQRCMSALFLETEEIYENGREAMEHYLYGECAGESSEEEEYHGRRGIVTAPCGHADSGLGSTPSCSPLFTSHNQRSFSLDDLHSNKLYQNLPEWREDQASEK